MGSEDHVHYENEYAQEQSATHRTEPPTFRLSQYHAGNLGEEDHYQSNDVRKHERRDEETHRQNELRPWIKPVNRAVHPREFETFNKPQ